MFFTIEKVQKQLAEVRSAIHRGIQDILFFKHLEQDIAGAERMDFDDRAWHDFRIGSYWGGYDVTAWFRAWVPVPIEWKNQKIALRFLVGPRDGGGSTAETLLYINGQPLQGIDIWHEEAWLPPEMLEEGCVLVALKAWSGVLNVPDRRRFKLAQLLCIDEAAESFYYTAATILSSVEIMPEDDLRRVRLLGLLNEAFQQVNFLKPGSEPFYQSISTANEYLQQAVMALPNNELKPVVIGVGHAHIDMAWLWKLQHSREKASRTFSTVLHLMRQYPEYCYMHSTPQLYQYLQHDYPDIYARVKDKIAEGRWEATGAMWVEADVNLPSGESLVRQFLLGKRFLKQEFGVDSRVLWLPDVFGYPWSLPQIARKCGIDYFLTSKISWNQFNRFPYDTFRWRGIDGTELLTHFITTPDDHPDSTIYTYNGQLDPQEVKGMWDNYRQKDANDELLQLFGWGDGGGGPTKEMLEAAHVMKNLPGIPHVQLGTAEPYFARLKQRLDSRKIPTWDDELYLEYHRGTYTSQAYNKRENRAAEVLYHNAEWLNVLAGALLPNRTYPSDALNGGWQLILLNQFHDILTGSSIREVYDNCQEDYTQIRMIGDGAIRSARQDILDQIEVERDSLVIFNSLSRSRTGLLDIPWDERLDGKTISTGANLASPVQIIEQDGLRRILLSTPEIPSLGYRACPLISANENSESTYCWQVATDQIENDWYRIELNPHGQITSLFDKANQRQVLPAGQRGNVLQIFEDKPLNFDAWDIDIYYQDKMHEITNLVETCVEETGPLRAVLRLCWRFLDSTITQRLIVYRTSPRIDFKTEVDWHEHQVLMKVAFPVAIRATRATYEIQFGSIERPTTWNTSWDYARFEVPGHRWADLSEGDYGVGLLNDCKYGYDVKDNVMRLTLIKSGIYPDPQADQGHHSFTYSLLPHSGDWRTGRVAEEAYDLNIPLIPGFAPPNIMGTLPDVMQFAAVVPENIIIETVKKAEDGNECVFRIYEFKQCRTEKASLRFSLPIRNAVECNLIEEDAKPANWQGNTLSFRIDPFEIKTFKVWF
jgi:alpha-mannosidase